MDIVWRAAVSGLFVGLILFVSQKMGPKMGGIFILFPFASLPIFICTARDHGVDKLRTMLMSSLITLPAWIAFALSLYLATLRFKLVPSIIISLSVWTVTAFALAFMKRPL